MRDPLHALERLSLALLVGGALFEFVTGILNIQFGTMRAALRTRVDVRRALERSGAPRARRDDPPARSLASPSPAPQTMSRRTLLATVAAGSALLGVEGAAEVDDRWRLALIGARTVKLSRAELGALAQETCELPIACVEGWSTTQRWTGVRLRDLARLCGIDGPAVVTARSLEHGTYGRATLGPEQVSDDRSLLALEVNGVALSLDHGWPARVIAPALPGVHCTKWVASLTFEAVPA